MSDFLSNLVRTHLGGGQVLQARLPSLFERTIPASETISGLTGEAVPDAPRVETSPVPVEQHVQTSATPSHPTPVPASTRRVTGPKDPIGTKQSAVVESHPIGRTQSLHAPEQHTLRANPRTSVGSESTQGTIIEPVIRLMRETVIRREGEVMPPPSPSSTMPHTRSESSPRSDHTSVHATPAVNVTIGRIEVRGVGTAAPVQQPRRAAGVMSLDEYLRQRSRGDKR